MCICAVAYERITNAGTTDSSDMQSFLLHSNTHAHIQCISPTCALSVFYASIEKGNFFAFSVWLATFTEKLFQM